ncbi:MAG: PIN domain-containing protein [Candidatus Marinimicrobia bacterium]|nr:PIN domain-containing protein [Candidatus Neomarinimicrobiota bacterium]MBL7011233.1 PIN domain-containing protein [Candidatus Neomarinimicrobiota bacterium]MBL7031285.1 PIN domain-containing protein [Candidatus Neomarinimicrobiota bacterium]
MFQDIERGRIRAVISPFTISEVLSGPLKQGNEILADHYYNTFTSGDGWFIQELNVEISLIATRIRIQYNLKLPDAIQIATANYSGSSALVTHDIDFKNLDEVLILGI